MKLLLLLAGMILIVEGLPYAAAPEAMRQWLAKLSELPAGYLRIIGIIAMVAVVVAALNSYIGGQLAKIH